LNIVNCEIGASTDNNSDNGLPIPVIAGAAGGAVTILFLIIPFCVVFLCYKRSRKKKAYQVSTVHLNAGGQSLYKKGL